MYKAARQKKKIILLGSLFVNCCVVPHLKENALVGSAGELSKWAVLMKKQ